MASLFSRVRALLAGMAVLAVGFVAAPIASADVTVGQTGPPLTTSALAGGWEFLQLGSTMPTAGTVTSFHTQAGSCSHGPGTYDFQVLRPLGNNQYEVLGHTGDQTETCAGELNSYTVNIPVKAGDLLGAYAVNQWYGRLSSSSFVRAVALTEPAVGATITAPPPTEEVNAIDESATLAPLVTTPALSPPPNSDGWNRGNVTVTLTATDTGGPGVASITYALTGAQTQAAQTISGSTASVEITTEGATTVTFRATDTAASAEPDKTVTVKLDKTAPTITVPGTITNEAASAAGTKISYAVIFADGLSDVATSSCTRASGSTFPIATTTVNCTATDKAGNSASASFKVTILHTYGPALSAPPWIHANALNANGARVYYWTSAYDLVDGPVWVFCSRHSGSWFPLGRTVVYCHAHDRAGHTTYAAFPVVVHDHTAPVITAPAITAEATSGKGAKVNYTVSAHDNVDGAVSASCSPTSGSTFPIGLTRVLCSARDHAGNVASAAFDLVVVHAAGPVLLVPETVTAEATGPRGAAVSFKVSGYDAVDGAVTPSCTPTSGSLFPLGTTHVTCTAVDKSGHTSTATFHVVVHDTAEPKLTLPATKEVWTRTSRGAVVSYRATAHDPVDGAITPKCRPVSGSRFKLGTTVVVCTAADRAGNIATGSFRVTVRANLPKISRLSQTAEVWRLGNALPRYAKATPVGTAFRFTLDRGARVTFAFTQRLSGRTVTVARLRHLGHAGRNSLHFDGRIDEHQWLAPGSYTLKITATANGLRSHSATLRFTIVS